MLRSEAEPVLLPNELQPISGADYALAIDMHLEKPETQAVLRTDQLTRLSEIKQFFDDEAKRGYVEAATGAGKTVLMTHLALAFQNLEEISGRKPSILIATSRKNLVHQIIGKASTPEKEKGFTKFAPELSVASFFSDSKQSEKTNTSKYDIVVTTYQSLKIMAATELMRDLTPEEEMDVMRKTIESVVAQYGAENDSNLFEQLRKFNGVMVEPHKIALGRSILEQFDIFWLDEGHNVLGESTEEVVVNDIPKDMPVIGFTATPNANQARRLENILPYKISSQSSKDAIEEGVLAPVMAIGVKSDAKIKGADLFDSSGEYRDERLSFLARDSRRNLLAIKVAQVLAKHGIGIIMPCLPGSEALHARLMADRLNLEGISAEAVYANSPLQQQVLGKFDEGDLDALTYTRLLGEGYDSNRAKAIINVAPTRSGIISKQRLGRILRKEGGGIAFAIDIIDEYDELNPPIHVSDILEGRHMETGDIVGETTDEQKAFALKVLASLREVITLAPEVRADYTNNLETFRKYPPITGGGLSRRQTGKRIEGSHYATPRNIGQGYKGVTEEILNKLWEMRGKEPDVMLGYDHFTIRPTYNARLAKKYLEAMPRGEPVRGLKDPVTGDTWWSAEAYATYLGGKYPHATPEVVDQLLTEFGDLMEWQPAYCLERVSQTLTTRKIFKIYKTSPQSTQWLIHGVEAYTEMLETLGSRKL